MGLAMRRFLLSIGFALAAVSPAIAMDSDQSRACGFDYDSNKVPSGGIYRTITLMRAAEAPRTWFNRSAERDAPNCPDDSKTCHRGYVLAGEPVLVVGAPDGRYVCAIYPKASNTSGWIRRASLVPLTPQPARGLRDWTGHYISWKNSIDIAVAGTALHASGEAVWEGFSKDDIHDGAFDSKAVPRGDYAVFVDDPAEETSCVVGVQFFAGYLLVSDNSQCGGMNVSFNGVYTRKR